MVPSPYSSGGPCFPGCIEWLLDNQLSDGSWGLPHHPLLVKDALSSTLASVLALKRWGVGEEQVNKGIHCPHQAYSPSWSLCKYTLLFAGLHFIGSNVTSATDECEHSPIGFDIIFPGMVEHAKDLDLNLPFEPKVFEAMLHRRELELRRYTFCFCSVVFVGSHICVCIFFPTNGGLSIELMTSHHRCRTSGI